MGKTASLHAKPADARLARRLTLGLLAAVSPQAIAQTLPAGTVIAPSGDTATTVIPNGTSATITTSTIHARTAFNTFNAFTVGSDFTVNLVVPTNTDNLVNVVRTQGVSIDGIVNSYKGAVAPANRGGNIYFVAPRGMVIGASGVVNVGALTVTTPRDSVADDIVNTMSAYTPGTSDAGSLSDSAEIIVRGRVNAIDGIRLHSRKVTLESGSTLASGVSALEALDAQNARIFESVVNTQGLEAGGAIVYKGGTLEIVGESEVLIAGKVQARAGATSDAGTVDIKSAGTIDVTGGASIVTDRTDAALAGAVTLTAEKSDSSLVGKTEAVTKIAIGGEIRSGSVTASAKASAITSYTDDTVLFATATLLGSLTGLNGGYQAAHADAQIDIAGTARISAATDLKIGAEATAKTEMPVLALSVLSPFQAAVIAATLDSTAKVNVTGAAQLTAGSQVDIRSTNTTKVDVSAMALNIGTEGSEKGAAAVGYGSATTRTEAIVGADAVVNAQTVNVAARNDHYFSVSATSMANNDGYAGVGFAMSEQDIQTRATFAGALSRTVDGVAGKATSLTVTALTDTEVNKTAGSTAVGNGIGGKVIVGVTNLATTVAGKVRELVSGQSALSDAVSGGDSNKHFRVGGAVSIALDKQVTEASAGAAGKKIDLTGDAIIAARTVDAGLRNNADASIASNDEATKENGATGVGVAAAVAYARHDHTTSATIAAGAQIVAGRLALGAETIVPITVNWTRFDSFGRVLSHLNGNLGLANTVTSGFTTATTAADDLGVAGSVNLNFLTGDTRAWIGENARITVGAAGAGFSDGIGMDWTSVADKALAVTALTRLESLIIGGQFSLLLGGNEGDGRGQSKVVGGSYTNPSHAATTVAGIGAGVQVSAAGGVAVKAQTDDQLIAVAPSSGKGAGVGIAGLANYAVINNVTRAVISNQAKVDAPSVGVNADQNLLVVNVAAPLPVSAEGSGVGVGVAINDITTDTTAGVVDTSAITRNLSQTLPNDWTPYIRTSALTVDASNDGWIAAFGLAGVSVDNDPDRTTIANKARDAATSTKIGSYFASATSSDGFLRQKIGGLLQQTPNPQPSGTKASFSLGLAGSGAVNLSQLTAQALVEGAAVDRYAGTGTVDVSVTASNTPVAMTGAGAGAKVAAGGATSVGIGGAVALDKSENKAVAAIANTTVSQARDTRVRAINGGARAAVGLAVALNTPPADQKPGEAAASVSGSIVINRDVAQAHIDDSTITGVSGGSGRDVELTAYNAPRIGAGGGAGYEGGKMGLGLAVTVVDIGDNNGEAATEALIRDSEITGVDTVSVGAADPAIILALAASAGKGAATVGIAGAGSYIGSDRTTRAGIGSIDGSSAITATGDVKVTAAATRNSALDAVALGQSADLTADVGYDFSAASTLGDLRSEDTGPLKNANGEDLVTASGTAGLMIAAGGSGQKSGTQGENAKGNVGASFAGIFASDVHEAYVDYATVTSDRLAVLGKDDAVRVGLAVGGSSGAEFGLNGSITLVEDSGATRARIGSAAGMRTVVNTGALDVLADDASVVATLAGSFTLAGKAALGASVAHVASSKTVTSDITRSQIGAGRRLDAQARLSGAIFDLAFSGAVAKPNGGAADLSALDAEEGGGLALPDPGEASGSGGSSGTFAVGGASTSNILTASARVKINDSTIDPLGGNRAEVALRATDSQFVLAAGIGFARAQKGAGGVGLVTNRRGGDSDGVRTAAEIVGGSMDAANIVSESLATADIKSLALGVAVGDKFAGGGSIVTNIIDGDVKALVTGGAILTAQNNAAILARSQDRLDVIGGGVGFSKSGGGLGISVVTNVMNADTIAAVEWGATRLTALANSGAGTVVVQGSLSSTPDLTAIGEDQAGLRKALGVQTVSVTGVAVNASSLNNVNIAALSVGAGEKAGVGGNVATTVMGGATEARIVDAEINQSGTAATRQQLDVSASDHTMINSLVGAVGVSKTAGIAGGLDLAFLGRDVRAYASNARLASAGATRIAAQSSQYTFGINVGLGVGKAGIAGAVSVTQFDAATQAYIDGRSVTADTLDVRAVNKTGSTIATGVASVGTAAIGGGVSVITSDNATLAAIGISDVDDASPTATTVRAGTVTIAADRSADLKLYSVGLAAGKVGVAGMASVLLTSDRTRAGLFGGSVRNAAEGSATRLAVHAGEDMTATVASGAAAGGVVGVAGAVGVTVVANTVEASLAQTDVSAATQTVEALSDRDIQAVTVSAGGGKVGVAASIGVVKIGTNGLDSNADGADATLEMVDSLGSSNPANDDVNALLTAQERAQLAGSLTTNVSARATGVLPANGTAARVLASKIVGDMALTATDTTKTRQDAGSLAAGGVGVGAGVAVTAVSNRIAATVDAASEVTGALGVTATAQGQAINNNAYVGAAGAVGVGAAVAVGTIENTVAASAGGKLTGAGSASDLRIEARDDSSAKSKLYNVVAAGGAVGGTVGTLLKGGSVSASTTGDARTSVNGYRSVIVNAASAGRIASEGVGASGGVSFAVTGAYVEAKDSVKVAATLGSGTYGYATTGIEVTAVRTPETFADVIGVSVGGLYAVGASVAKAEVDDDVTAEVSSGVRLTNTARVENGVTLSRGSDLSIIAKMTRGAGDTARAEAQAGTGGGLVGANGSVAMAFNTSRVRALSGNDVRLGYGDVSILADRQSNAISQATGISVGGVLALGATYAETKAGGSIEATLGNGIMAADGSAATVRALSVSATGEDSLDSSAIAGSGGVIAGAASVAKNTHETSILAQTANASTARQLTAASLKLLGNYIADSVARVDSTQAAVLGGSGADARRTIDTSVTTRVGSNTQIDAYDATIAAYQTSKVQDGGATAASGGLFNGAAALSQTWITPEVKAVFDEGAAIDVLGSPYLAPGRLSVQAANTVTANDTAKLDVGSGIPIAEAQTRITSDTLNQIDIARNVQLTSAGQIDIGAYSINQVNTDARISTYGGVGSAGGDAEAIITATHNVNIAAGALVRGGDRVNIGAGTSGSGIDSSLNARAINDTYNWTAAPVNTRPGVKARATSNATLTIADGATVESVRDVNLAAYEGTRSAFSDGTGHNPFLEIFSTTVDRSDHEDSGTGTLEIDGAVRAGIQAKQTVAIAANGTITRGPSSGGITVQRSVYKVRSELQAKVDELAAVDRTGMSATDLAKLDGELAVFRQLLAEAPPEPLTAAERTALEARRDALQADRVRVAANEPQVSGEDGAQTVLTPTELASALADIDAELNGIAVQLSATSFPTTYAYTIGDIYAAAGDVTLRARTLSGSTGSVQAEGGATIAVTNSSQDYLVVNSLYIPDGDNGGGGHVRLTGGAAATQAALSIREIDKDQLASIRVENNATSGKAGIFLTGAISNIGGSIEVINQTGSIAQFAPVAGRTLSITAPNGTYAVNLPNGIFHAGAAPEAAWRPYALLPSDASMGAFMVANYLYNRNPDGSLKTLDSEQFTRNMLDISCGDRCVAPVLFYDMINRKNVDDGQFRWAYSGGSFFSMMKVPVYSLTKTGSVANLPALDPRDGITARTLIVNARDINITAPAKIGRNNNYSLRVASDLDTDIAAIRAAAARRGVALTGVMSLETLADQYGARDYGLLSPLFNFLEGRTDVTNVGLRALGTLGAADERIGVKYDFDNNRLITSDVDGAGGGSIKLTGRIFSTTTYGALQVNNGFGDIRVSNDSSAALLLGAIDTGRGSVGRIQITDLNRTGYANSPLTTWYIYENGGDQLSIYNNAATGAADYVGLAPISVTRGRDAVYNPAAGYRYQWTLSRSAKRYVIPGQYPDEFAVYRQGVSDWVWNETDWQVHGQSFYYSGQNLPVYNQQITGSITGRNQTATGTYNLSFSTTDGSFAWGDGKHIKLVTGVTGVQVNANISVKADNPIAIRFTGNSVANVNIQSRGAVTLAGNITNPTGATAIATQGGVDARSSSGATIETGSLSLGGRWLGSRSNPLDVVMNGTLDATATAGDISLAINGLAQVNTVSASGDVMLSAVQGIVGNSSGASITGRNISLAASAGRITGLNGGALTINATSNVVNGNTVGGELSATARDSINLRQPSGNLRLQTVTSAVGDVSIEAATGSISNAIAEFRIDEENQQRLARVWSDLGLTDPASVLRAVQAFERDITTQQAERARILNQVTMVDGVVTAIGKAGLTSEQVAAARAVYSGQAKAALGLAGDPSESDILSYVQGRYDAIERYVTETFGADRPAGFNSTDLSQPFTYTLDPGSARYQDLTRGVWTESQLAQSISGTALIPVDNTTILLQSPNVSGKDVTLRAAAGSIGQNLAAVEITATPGRILSAAERATLAAAGPGDIRVEDLAGGGKKLVISQQRLVNVKSTSTVTAEAQGDLYLGSAASMAAADLRSGQTARINLAGSLTNAAAVGSAAIRARDLLLEASGGSIGTAGRALSVQVSNQLLSVRAGRDVRIEQMAGDLRVGVGFANNLFSLKAASGSILSAFGNTEEVRLQGGSMQLVAQGSLGRDDARLQVQVANNGSLAGSAANAAIYSPLAPLAIGAMAIGQSAVINGRDLQFLGPFTAERLISLAPTGTITVSGDLLATRGLQLEARGMQVQGGSSIRMTGAASDAMALRAGTDGLAIGGVGGSSLVSSLGELGLWSNGAFSLGDGAALLASGSLLIDGQDHAAVGNAARIESRLGGVTVRSASFTLGDGAWLGANGDLDLETTSGLMRVGHDAALAGSTIALTSASDLVFGHGAAITSGGTLGLTGSAGSLRFGDRAVLRGASVGFNAGQAIVMGDAANIAASRGTVSMAGGSATFGNLADVRAADALTLITRQGDVLLGNGATLAGTGISLGSAGAVAWGDAAQVTASGPVLLTAAGAFRAANDAAITSGGDVSIDATSITLGDGASMQAIRDMAVRATGGSASFGARARLGGATITISAADAMTLGAGSTLDATGALDLSATAAMVLGDAATLGADAIQINAGSLGMGSGAALTAAETLALTARGAMDIGAGGTFSGRTLALLADAITIGADADLRAGGTLTALARRSFAAEDRLKVQSLGGAIELAGGSIALGADARIDAATVKLVATGGDLVMGDGASLVAQGALIADAAQTLRLGAGTNADAAQATLAGRDVVLANGVRMQLAGAGLLTARGGDLVSAATLGADTLALRATRDAIFDQGALSASGIDIAAGRDLRVSAGRMQAADALVLDAAGAMWLGDGAEFTGHTIAVNAASITLQPARMAAVRRLDLMATNTVAAAAGTQLGSGDATMITGRYIAFASGTRVDAGTDIAIRAAEAFASEAGSTAGASITVDAGTTLAMRNANAGGKIVVTAGQGVQIGRLESRSSASDAVSLASGGSIEGQADADLHVAAQSGGLVVRAQSNVGTDAVPLRIDVRKLAANSTAGNLNVRAIGPVTMTGAALAGLFRTSATGALSIDELNARAVDFASTGSFRWNRGTIQTGTITADGGIAGTGLRAGQSLALFAPTIDFDIAGPESGTLQLDVAGIGERALAANAVLRIAAPGSVRFGTLLADNGTLVANTPSLEIGDGIVGSRLDVTMPEVTVLLTRARIRAEQVTIQGRAATGGYSLKVDGRKVTTDAAVMGGQATRSDGGYIDPSMLLPNGGATPTRPAPAVSGTPSRPLGGGISGAGGTAPALVALPPEADDDGAVSIGEAS